MSILIKNVLIGKDRKDVYIEGNRIRHIQSGLSIEAEHKIDGTGKAILPSLMNAHTHSGMSLFRGIADEMELHGMLRDKIWPLEATLTEDDVYAGSCLSMLEMIKSGTTFFADMYYHFDGIAKAVNDMGMRAHIASVFIDGFNPDVAEDQIRLCNKNFYASKDYSSRVKFMLGPHCITSVSEESLLWAAEFAWKNDLIIQMHIAESFEEVQECLRLKDIKRPVEYLDSIGFLSKNVQAVHGVWLKKSEFDLIKKNEVTIVHCPVSNIKTRVGTIFPYEEYRALDINVLLGTDGPATNNSQDMLSEMKFSLMSQMMNNCMKKNCLQPQDVFESATTNIAKAFGIDCGLIEEGKLADCILLDLKHPSLVPTNNLISNLLYSATSACVDTTICDGKILMQARKVANEDLIVERAQRVAQDVLGRVK